jgi:hypothetical protein
MRSSIVATLVLLSLAGCKSRGVSWGWSYSDLFPFFGGGYSNASNSVSRQDDFNRREREVKEPPLYSSGSTNPVGSLPNDSWSPY